MRKHRFIAVSAAGHAVAQCDGGDEYSAAQRTERTRRHAGHRDHGAHPGKGGAATGSGPSCIAARELPGGQGGIRTAEQEGKRAYVTSCFQKQALDEGAEQFKWSERVARQPKQIGTKVRGVGVALSSLPRRHDRVRWADRDHAQGPRSNSIRHRKPWNRSRDRRASRRGRGAGRPWDACDIVWGDTSKNFPYTCVRAVAKRRTR